MSTIDSPGVLITKTEIAPDGKYRERVVGITDGPYFSIRFLYDIRDIGEKRGDLWYFGPIVARSVYPDLEIAFQTLFIVDNAPFVMVRIFLYGKLIPYLMAINYRILMTLWVWGLADRDPACTMSWNNVKLVRMLKGKK